MAFDFTPEKQLISYVLPSSIHTTFEEPCTSASANYYSFNWSLTDCRNQLWAVTSAVGAVLCFLVLLVVGFVWLHQPSRHHLDRVSFRIVMYALVAK